MICLIFSANFGGNPGVSLPFPIGGFSNCKRGFDIEGGRQRLNKDDDFFGVSPGLFIVQHELALIKKIKNFIKLRLQKIYQSQFNEILTLLIVFFLRINNSILL